MKTKYFLLASLTFSMLIVNAQDDKKQDNRKPVKKTEQAEVSKQPVLVEKIAVSEESKPVKKSNKKKATTKKSVLDEK